MRGKRYLLFIVSLVCMFTFVLSYKVNVFANDSIDNLVEGTKFGDVRKEIVLNTESYLAVSTEKKLYFIKEGNIINEFELYAETIFLDVCNDINNNGYDELLIITNAKDKDNILFYDTFDNSLIFSYVSKMSAYDSNLGYYDERVVVEDYIIEESKAVFIAGYNAFVLDLTNGKLIWNYLAKDNLWDIESIGDINNDDVLDYAVSLQTTNIISLSGKTGKVIYNVKVSESVDYNNNNYLTSIWSMQYDDETKELYAASQNGKVYVLDSINGKVNKSKQIFIIDNFSEYFDNFEPYKKKLSIKLISDITGDNKKDLIYYQMTRPNNYSYINIYSNYKKKILFLNGNTLNSLENEILLNDHNIYYQGEYNNQDVFYILENIYNETSFNIFSIKDNNYITDKLIIDNNKLISSDNYSVYNSSYIFLNNQDLYSLCYEGITYIKNNNAKYIPKISVSNFINSGDNLLFMKGTGSEFYGNGSSNYKYFIFEMYDLSTRNKKWTYMIPSADFLISKGAANVNYSTDFNNDNINDIILILNTDNILETFLPTIILLDGKTGVELNRVNMSSIKSSGMVNDMNGDNVKDYYVQNEIGEISYYDLKTGSIIKTIHDIEFSIDNIYLINDINDDGKNDFIQIVKDNENDKYNINYLKTTGEGFSVELYKSLNGDLISSINYLGDLDNDNVLDISFLTRKNQDTYYHVISSKTGKEVINISSSYDDLFYLSNFDINNDNLFELFRVSVNRNTRRSNISLIDLGSNPSKELFISDDFDSYYGNNKPAVIFKGEDGRNYVVIDVQIGWEGGESIEIYDLDTKQLVKNIEIKKNNYTYDNRKMLGSLNVVNDNNQIYFYNFSNQDGYGSNPTRSYVYNYNNNKMYFNYEQGIHDLLINDNNIILLNNNNDVIMTNIDNNLKIENVEENEKINKIINLKIIKQDGEVKIYVDNALVGKTENNSYKLKMLEGKHTIKISQKDINGIEYEYCVNVEVTKNYTYMIIIFCTTITLFALTIILPRKKRKYKIPTSLVEGSDGNE